MFVLNTVYCKTNQLKHGWTIMICHFFNFNYLLVAIFFFCHITVWKSKNTPSIVETYWFFFSLRRSCSNEFFFFFEGVERMYAQTFWIRGVAWPGWALKRAGLHCGYFFMTRSKRNLHFILMWGRHRFFLFILGVRDFHWLLISRSSQIWPDSIFNND